MRIIAKLYLLIMFQLSRCFKPTKTRTSTHSPRSKNRLCLAHDPTMIYAQGAVNCAVVTVLGIALYFQEKNQRERLATNSKDFEETLARQDAEFR